MIDKVAKLEKLAVTQTTDKAAFLHVDESAIYPVLDFEMEGKTEQFTGIVQSEDGSEVKVPNPEYPQEIINAGVFNEDTGRYEIHCKVAGKNLFYKQNEYRATCDIPLTAGTTITCSAELDFEENVDIVYVDGTQESLILNQTINQRKSSVEYLLPKDVEQILFGQYAKEPQVEVGALTDYEPYHATEFVITSPGPLTKWDKLVKRDGVWGWSVSGVKVIFDGTETWGLGYGSGNGTQNSFELSGSFFTIPFACSSSNGYLPLEVKSNAFKYEETGAIPNTNCFRVTLSLNSDKAYALFSPDTSFIPLDDEEAWCNYLSEQYNNGTPVYIQYVAKEEQAFNPLSDEEQSLLNKLETYYGVTNVYNDQDCPMWIEYVADTKTYIEQNYMPKSEIEESKNQIAELQTLVVSNV